MTSRPSSDLTGQWLRPGRTSQVVHLGERLLEWIINIIIDRVLSIEYAEACRSVFCHGRVCFDTAVEWSAAAALSAAAWSFAPESDEISIGPWRWQWKPRSKTSRGFFLSPAPFGPLADALRVGNGRFFQFHSSMPPPTCGNAICWGGTDY